MHAALAPELLPLSGAAGVDGIHRANRPAPQRIFPALVAATVKAAALLTAGHAVATGLVSVSVIALKEGVLKGMLISKLKAAAMAALILGGAFAVGSRTNNHLSVAGDPARAAVVQVYPNVGINVRSPSPIQKVEAGDRATVEPAWNLSALVTFLDDNARRVKSIRCDDLELTVISGLRTFGMRGALVAKRSRRFRLSTRCLAA